jgi:hypothetical protein
VSGLGPYLAKSRPTRLYLNPVALSPLSLAQIRGGNLKRNEISAPGLVTLDATSCKTFDITETVKFQVKASAFNLLNHTNYRGLAGNTASLQFGQQSASSLLIQPAA